MYNRRGFFRVGLFAFAASGGSLTMSGCADGAHQLRMIGEDSSNAKAIKGVLPQFEKASHIHTIADLEDYATALSQSDTDFARRAGRYDIVLQYNFSLSPFVRNDYITHIGDLKRIASDVDFSFEPDLLPNVWRELGYYAKRPFRNLQDAEAVAYPFCANTMVLAYNKRILSDQRVATALKTAFGEGFTLPQTWPDFARAVRIIHDAVPHYHGVALQGATGGWLYYEWVNMLFGLGGKVMNKSFGWQSDTKTPLTLRSPAADQASALYLSMRDANAGDFFSVDAVKQRDLMLVGDTAFAIMWTDYIPDLAMHDSETFGFAPVPGGKSMIAGGSYFVSDISRKRKEAAALISFLMTPAIQKQMALAGLFPPTRSTLNDPDVLSKPYMPAVRDSLARGVYMLEAGPDSDLISQEITNALQKAWKRQISASDVATVAATAIASGRLKLDVAAA